MSLAPHFAKHSCLSRCTVYRSLQVLVVACTTGLSLQLWAHPLEPTILELRELDGKRWEAVAWKSSGALPLPLQVQLPAPCTPRTLRAVPWAEFSCIPGTMSDAFLSIGSPTETQSDVWVRVRFADGKELTGSTEPGTGRFHVRRADLLPLTTVARTYFVVGVRHVMEGIDHLLFLAGLVWLLRSGRELLFTLSMFTLGHTLALVLAAGHWLSVEQKIVEVFIGASIVLVARELWHPAQANLTRFFGFPFGLLHGLGFAGALEDLGLNLLSAVVFFNVGVEVAQLLWVCPLGLLVLLARHQGKYDCFWAQATGAVVGVAGAWITLKRLLTLVPPQAAWP